MSGRTLWALVRIDHYLEDLYHEANNADPVRALVTVTRLHEREADAQAHRERVSRSHDPGEVEYFVSVAEVEALGASPVIFVGLRAFSPGGRVSPSQVVIGPVWPSLAAATEGALPGKVSNAKSTVIGSFQAARLQSSRVRATPAQPD